MMKRVNYKLLVAVTVLPLLGMGARVVGQSG